MEVAPLNWPVLNLRTGQSPHPALGTTVPESLVFFG